MNCQLSLIPLQVPQPSQSTVFDSHGQPVCDLERLLSCVTPVLMVNGKPAVGEENLQSARLVSYLKPPLVGIPESAHGKPALRLFTTRGATSCHQDDTFLIRVRQSGLCRLMSGSFSRSLAHTGERYIQGGHQQNSKIDSMHWQPG